ncbi:SprT family zinc-dependent metalloprotease [Erythrobacter sp. F6033]|uniref:M48 family metallopeptidase n=1 Tax=Erythrobacter sp. F6033 TaxID=2926401 RepID=UPI001FF4ACE7|nr:SprT family zinc-dependent metalloprotease [Erythrobacter sp. F6033]MCK0129314.1 M48 family metallopeptidase [Erythrobacter sp. F6033]
MIDWLKRTSSEPEIEIGEATLPIVLKRHRTAKRLTMRLAPDGSEVRITLPRWADASEAIAFARGRKEWLTTQLAKVPARTAIEPGSELTIRGNTVTVQWDAAAARRPKLIGAELHVGGPLEGLETRVRRWLEREALNLFEEETRHYCNAANLAPVPVGLSRAQKRWGSCSEKSRIRLNWRLIQAPDFVRRSVVAHEVTHLVHFDHSPAFHALLGNLYEGDIGKADRWLKTNGRSLYSSFG